MTAAGKIKNQFIGREEMIADIYLNDYFYLNTNCVPSMDLHLRGNVKNT